MEIINNRQVIVNLFGGLSPLCIPFNSSTLVTVQDLKSVIASRIFIPPAEQRLVTNSGRTLYDETPLFQSDDEFLIVNLRLGLLGGKGGFGSMLRAQGGKMASQKTTNFEACRDLNGRRLRTINEAKKLADYLEGEPERQRAKEDKLKKKIEEGLREPPNKKHRFNDPSFLDEKQNILEDVKASVSLAMQTKKQEISKSVTKKTNGASLSMWEVESSDDGNNTHDEDVEMTDSAPEDDNDVEMTDSASDDDDEMTDSASDDSKPEKSSNVSITKSNPKIDAGSSNVTIDTINVSVGSNVPKSIKSALSTPSSTIRTRARDYSKITTHVEPTKSTKGKGVATNKRKARDDYDD